MGDGDGTLRVEAEGEAGDAEDGGFFLNAAGVCEEEAGIVHEAEEIEIALRRAKDESVVADAFGFQALARAGMHREDDRHARGDGAENAEERGETRGVVDIGGAVKRGDREPAWMEAEAGEDIGARGAGA